MTWTLASCVRALTTWAHQWRKTNSSHGCNLTVRNFLQELLPQLPRSRLMLDQFKKNCCWCYCPHLSLCTKTRKKLDPGKLKIWVRLPLLLRTQNLRTALLILLLISPVCRRTMLANEDTRQSHYNMYHTHTYSVLTRKVVSRQCCSGSYTSYCVCTFVMHTESLAFRQQLR